jgi:hypothetical protein
MFTNYFQDVNVMNDVATYFIDQDKKEEKIRDRIGQIKFSNKEAAKRFYEKYDRKEIGKKII